MDLTQFRCAPVRLQLWSSIAGGPAAETPSLTDGFFTRNSTAYRLQSTLGSAPRGPQWSRGESDCWRDENVEANYLAARCFGSACARSGDHGDFGSVFRAV